MALVVVLLPFEGSLNGLELAVALALQAPVALMLAFGHRVRGERAAALLAIAIFMASIALLRDCAAAGTGYGPLVLLPVIWSALRGRRVELATAIALAGLVFFVPVVAIGAPQYPAMSARGGAFIVVVSAILGASVLGLVSRLRASAADWRQILATMSDGFALTRNGTIVAVNPALSRITGFAESELVGAASPYPFWPPELHNSTEALRRQVVADGGGEFELMLMRADGERFPAAITATPTQLGDGSRAFVNTMRDITGRRQQEQAMLRRADELTAIAQVTRAVSHSDHDDARRTICRVAVEVTGATNASIWEAGPDGTLHNTTMLEGAPTQLTIGNDQRENALRLTWHSGDRLFIADAARSPHVDQNVLRTWNDATDGVSFDYWPITDSKGVRGVLVLAWTPAIPAPRADADPVLEVLAGEAAAAMERADLLNRLEELSRTDELTGLPNRRAWEELLDREMRVARRTGQPLALAMLDLDFFKAYNDHHGHLGGDRLLWLAANLWQDNLRDTDVLARWGGEEFSLLLPSCDEASALTLVERLRALPLDGVTFSAGLAEWDGVSPPKALIAEADEALYRAKHSGRNRTELRSPAPAA